MAGHAKKSGTITEAAGVHLVLVYGKEAACHTDNGQDLPKDVCKDGSDPAAALSWPELDGSQDALHHKGQVAE